MTFVSGHHNELMLEGDGGDPQIRLAAGSTALFQFRLYRPENARAPGIEGQDREIREYFFLENAENPILMFGSGRAKVNFSEVDGRAEKQFGGRFGQLGQ